MTHTALIRGQPRSRASDALAAIKRAVNRLAHSWERRRQLAHAADLDDHLLRDIGLTRESVNSARRLQRWRKAS